jgi:Transposase IS116/IS110/IS902 family
MRIIGCDLHTRQQTLAMLDTETGELVNLTLMQEGNEVREFYSQLPRPVLVGIEATGSMQWFLSALQALYRKMEEEIENLTKQVAEQAEQRTRARRLMTHPGVGPVTALATDVFLGDPGRFVDGKALASYVGIIPREYSSGGNQRLGRITKQGSPLLRFLWCEAGAHAVRRDPELQRFYRRKLVHKGLGRARVAVARKLGIRLWIMLRDEIDYEEFCRRGQKHQSGAACAGMLEVGNGANRHRPVD